MSPAIEEIPVYAGGDAADLEESWTAFILMTLLVKAELNTATASAGLLVIGFWPKAANIAGSRTISW